MALFAIAVTFAAIGFGSYEGAAALVMSAPLILANIENSDDAKQKRSQLWDRMNEMIQLRKSEKRDFTDDEKKEYDQLKSDFDILSSRVKELEEDEKRALIMAGNKSKYSAKEKEARELSKYSLTRAIRLEMDKRQLDGLEGEMHQEAVKEMREANTGKDIQGIGVPDIMFRTIAETRQNTVTGDSGNAGGHYVPTIKSGLITALRPRLVLATLGAQTLGGLSGNVDFPKMAAVTSGWKTEVDDADASKPASSVVSMSPKRLTSLLSYSRQLLIQSSPDVNAFLVQDLLRSISQNVELAAINGASTGEDPTGIINTASIGDVDGNTNGAAPTWAHIVKLEEEVSVNDADIESLAYLTNTKVRSKLKQTTKTSEQGGFVWEPGDAPLNGYKVGVTNLVPSNLEKGGSGEACSAIIFGNFNDLVIGNWGGMDIIVDPYTNKKAGVVEIAANTYWDVGVLRVESFAAMKDALTV